MRQNLYVVPIQQSPQKHFSSQIWQNFLNNKASPNDVLRLHFEWQIRCKKTIAGFFFFVSFWEDTPNLYTYTYMQYNRWRGKEISPSQKFISPKIQGLCKRNILKCTSRLDEIVTPGSPPLPPWCILIFDDSQDSIIHT